MNKILIFGASGFVGSHLARAFVEAGSEVVAGVRVNSVPWRLAALGLVLQTEVVEITEPGELDSTLRRVRPNVVINCTAYGVRFLEQDFESANRTNTLSLFHLANSCHKHDIERLVHIGSCFEYGAKDEPIRENDSLHPTGIYGVTKAAGTLALLERAESLALNAMILRPFGLWGPLEDKTRLCPQLMAAKWYKRNVLLTPCEQRRDYLYIKDAARSIVRLVKESNATGVVNLGSGQSVVLRDFVVRVASALDCVDLLQFGAVAYRPNEMMNLLSDIAKLESLIGKQSVTEFELAVRETWECWVRARGDANAHTTGTR